MFSIQAAGIDRPPGRHRSDRRFAGLARGALFAAVAAVSACHNYSTETRINERTGTATEQFVEIAFDDRLLDGLEDFWSHCVGDLMISAFDPGALDLVGRCATNEGREGLSENGNNVLGVVSIGTAVNPVTVDLPNPLIEFPMRFAFEDWPIQNCRVRSNTEVVFESLRLRDLEARWTLRDGKPALRLRLVAPRQQIAHRMTTATANCPSGVSERTVQNKLDKSGINGGGLISVDEMTISIYMTFEPNAAADAIVVRTDVATELDGIDVGIAWSKLPGRAKEAFDDSIASLGSQVAAPIAAQLSTVGLLLQPRINDAYPNGHEICALETRRVPGSGTHWPHADEFVIRTQHPTLYGTPCLRMVHHEPGQFGQAPVWQHDRPIDHPDIQPIGP